MPFIDAKITQKLDPATKETLKQELGKTMAYLGKSEAYLMVGIDDDYDLWFGGKKLENGAYIALSLLGDASADATKEVSGAVCDLLSSLLGIEGQNVYITYHPIKNWGWNGTNF